MSFRARVLLITSLDSVHPKCMPLKLGPRLHCNVAARALDRVEICFAKIIRRPPAMLVVGEGRLQVGETLFTQFAVGVHLTVVPPLLRVLMPHMELDVVLSSYPYLVVVVVARAYRA